jgi:Anti-sigma-K factor rskA
MDEISRNAEGYKPPKDAQNGFDISKWLPLILLVAASVFGFLQFQRNAGLRQEIDRQAGLLKACDEERAKSTRLQAFLLHPQTRHVDVQWIDTTKTASDGLAIAYDNRGLNEVFVQVIGLSQLPSDQDYQFWVLLKDNPDPVPHDVFQANSEIFNLKQRGEVAGFAVSIEPKGGSPNGKPTTVVMLGT